MARYIDVDKLMEECKNHTMDEVYPEWNDKKVFDALCQMGHMFKKIIDETPTADIEAIKRETIKEFAEGLFQLFPADKNFTTISRNSIKLLVIEKTEGKNGARF